jgi:type III pantothenate kinase
MLLAVDVGNTNTVLGLYAIDDPGQPLAASWRVTTHLNQTVDEYGVFFRTLFRMNGLESSVVRHIIISSVVPPLETTLRSVCEKYFNQQPVFLGPGIKSGMPILVENPAELGADRLADCVAA